MSDGYFTIVVHRFSLSNEVKSSIYEKCVSDNVFIDLCRFHHNTLREAYTHLVERRRIASPNTGFFLQLIRYEKELRARKEIDDSKRIIDETNPVEPIYPHSHPASIEDETQSETTIF